MINLYCEAWHPRALATSVDEPIYAVLPARRSRRAGGGWRRSRGTSATPYGERPA